MPSRVIVAASTGGTNMNKKHGEYVSFDTITSDTGPVSNAHVTSATLYISSYQVWITTAWLNVIYGTNSGTIVANTQLLHKNSEAHSSTETLDNLTSTLLTASVSQMRLGVRNQNTSSTNTCVNVRNGCTITLTINYEYNTTACSPPTSVSVNKTNVAPGASVTLSWSGAKAGTSNAITGYHIYRRKTQTGGGYEHAYSLDTTSTSGSITVTAPGAMGKQYEYQVYTIGAAGLNSGPSPACTLTTAVSDFTDPTLTSKKTPIKAIHMTELQQRVNGLRNYYGLSAYTFTPIVAGQTSLGAWNTHVRQIREAFDALGISHAAWIDVSVNCPTAAVMKQLRDIVMAG